MVNFALAVRGHIPRCHGPFLLVRHRHHVLCAWNKETTYHRHRFIGAIGARLVYTTLCWDDPDILLALELLVCSQYIPGTVDRITFLLHPGISDASQSVAISDVGTSSQDVQRHNPRTYAYEVPKLRQPRLSLRHSYIEREFQKAIWSILTFVNTMCSQPLTSAPRQLTDTGSAEH
jgi:hypothetical protein